MPSVGAGNSAICLLLPVGLSRADRIAVGGDAKASLEIVELAQQRGVLARELFVWLPGCLEHREGEGAAAGRGRDDAGGEAEKVVIVRAGEHVDHAGGDVGMQLEEELAECVDDLVVAVDAFEFAGALGRPFGSLSSSSRLLCACDDELARRLALLDQAVRLRDLLEGEHTRGPGLVVAGLDLLDDLLEGDRRERERLGAELEAAEEAELDAARHVDEREEAVEGSEAAEESGLADASVRADRA